MRIAFIDRLSLGLLVGWSWLPNDETTNISELNLYLLFFCIHITWGHDE